MYITNNTIDNIYIYIYIFKFVVKIVLYWWKPFIPSRNFDKVFFL